MTDYLLAVKKLTVRLKLNDVQTAATNGPHDDLVQPRTGLASSETAYENGADAPESIWNSSGVNSKNNDGLSLGQDSNNIFGINIQNGRVKDTCRQTISSDRLKIYSNVSSTNNIYQAISCRKLSSSSEQNAKATDAMSVMPINGTDTDKFLCHILINDPSKRNGAVPQSEQADKTVSLQKIHHRKPSGVLMQNYLTMYQEVRGDRGFLGSNYSNHLKHTSSKLQNENDRGTSSEQNQYSTNSVVTGASKRRVSATRSMPILLKQTREWQSLRCCELQKKKDMLTSELMAMQISDQEIAKKLLQLYSEIYFTKVKRSCLGYSELLDEAIYNAETENEVPNMCDLPEKSINSVLHNRGVTRHNISSRRFSCI